MKHLLTIAFLLVVLSCGQNSKSNKNNLLTSSMWTMEEQSIDEFYPKMADKYKFLTDGTCLLVSGETEIYGQWNWTKDGEIFIRPEGTFLNGQKIKADSSMGLYIKIVELTDTKFRTLERMEADNWNSGLIKERTYTALSL